MNAEYEEWYEEEINFEEMDFEERLEYLFTLADEEDAEKEFNQFVRSN